MREALKLGGKSTYDGLKADVTLNPVPPDAVFLAELIREGEARKLEAPVA